MKKIIVLLSAATILVSCSFLPIKKNKQLQYQTHVFWRTMVCCDVIMQKGESDQNRKIFNDEALWNATDSAKILLMDVKDWENGRDY